MMTPAEEVDLLLNRVLADAETESEFGRRRAYRTCVQYAEKHLSTDHRCNLFLIQAAERLGQPPMVIPIVYNRVPLPPGAAVHFYYDDDEGPVLVGNSEGLHYVGDVCRELSQALVPGECVVIDEEPPLVGDSYELTIYIEDEQWFEAAAEGREGELAEQWENEVERRIVAFDDVVAFQLRGAVPGHLELTPEKLYRVHGITPFKRNSKVPRKLFRNDPARTQVVSLTDDDGHALLLGVEPDDPDVTFYYAWHLEQFGPPPEPPTGDAP
ncbi:MAG: hypothetical protein HYU66_19030 [Armatimonadetes bacterium]|nr:hypothetical protein [Armatimonadota bacterium]